jgi:hypothetical protein
MAYGNGPRIITNGLIFAVDAADRNSYPGSGTTWFDLQANRDDSILTNGPTFNSDNGGSIVFDGVDDVGASTDVPGALMTVSIWVYKTSTATNQGIITRNNTIWGIAQISGTLRVLVVTIGSYTDTGYTIPLNQWVNIVYTYAGTGLSDSQVVYINGTSIFTGVGTGNLSTGRIRGSPFFIGAGNSSYWGGRIAQVQVYNRPLPTSEVLQNYNNQKSRFGL